MTCGRRPAARPAHLPDCLEPYQPSAEELAFLRSVRRRASPTGGLRRHGAGCNFCAHTGYLDRIGVYELLPITDEIRELIVDRAPHDEMRKLAPQPGHAHPAGAGRAIWSSTASTTLAEVMRAIYVGGSLTMPKFAYVGVTLDGSPVKGIDEADEPRRRRARALRAAELRDLQVTEKTSILQLRDLRPADQARGA